MMEKKILLGILIMLFVVGLTFIDLILTIAFDIYFLPDCIRWILECIVWITAIFEVCSIINYKRKIDKEI